MYTLKKENTKVEIEMTIDAQEWESGVQKVYEQNKGKFNVVGFRKGHAPRKVIEKTYGDSVFFEDTVDLFVNKTMNEVLQANPDLEPVAMPTTRFESCTAENGLKMKILFEIVPDFKLCKYTGNEIKVHSAEVTEHEIEHEIHHLLEDNAKFDAVERAIKNGDVALIDFMGFIDNVEFAGGTGKDYSLEIGSHTFIDNFEEQLIGHKKGDKVDVNVTFPKDYGAAEFQGKKALFKVDIKEVREKHLPELNDKFIADATEFETVEEYRKHITAHIQDMKTNDQEQEYEYNLRELLLANTEIEIPEIMIANQVEGDIHRMREMLEAYGLTLEQYIMQSGGTTLEEYEKSMRERVLKNIKTRFIYRKIIEEEKLEPSQEESSKALDGIQDHEEQIRKENEIALDKLLKFLKNNNKMIVTKD